MKSFLISLHLLYNIILISNLKSIIQSINYFIIIYQIFSELFGNSQ
jgi:hypothetical protein